MANVWKLGTRWSDWGDSASSVLSIMRRNNTAFVWLDGNDKEKFLSEVKKGDYIALADGYQIVAIGKVTGNAGYLRDFKNFQISKQDFPDFSIEDGLDSIVAAKINIVDIEDEDKEHFWYEKRSRFCYLNQLWNETIKYYEDHVNRFDIKSYTATLDGSSIDKHGLINSKVSYIVPVYQRPYEWGEREIRPFINDILTNYMGKDGTACLPESMFIGTMQLSKRKPISNNEYQHEIVDGQQRITTLTIFLRELQKHFDSCKRLASLKFQWLYTHVSNQQSLYLYNYLHENIEEPQNPYQKNSRIIWDTFDLFLQNMDEDVVFDVDKFCDYLFHQVCFVVIETSAGLSKTIQIFNTINNTGLDLNGSDLFKIRMYEYLRDVKGEDEEVFDKIQSVYTSIDVLNKKHNVKFSMGTMLDVYKNVLITKYDLSVALYAFGWDTFFDRLFDSLLGINDWENFKNLNGLELSLDTLQEIIEMWYEIHAYNYKNVETKMASEMISNFSRYSRSKGLVMYPFLYFYRKDDDRYIQLERLLVILNKYFFIHSIEHSKQINQVNTFIANLVKSIRTKDSEQIISTVINQIANEDKEWLKSAISQDLFSGSKWWPYLVCGISTYLCEREIGNNDENIMANIFNKWEFDIEHIHATADNSLDIPSDLQNSIGNLTPLEYDINRSIQNAAFQKKRDHYKGSRFLAIQEISKGDKWDVEDIKKRRAEETDKIFDYITTEKELSFQQ